MVTHSLAAQLSVKRSEMMLSELEAVALRLFEQRGFADVTVEDIASEAHVSVRTFYRYFPAKGEVLQAQIARRSNGLRAALAARPADEPPLQSVRLAFAQELAAEDAEVLRRWIAVIAATPSLLQGVLGGIHLKTQRVIAEFFGSRIGVASDEFAPSVLAGAVGGVIQAAQTHWYFHGGDLVTKISEGLGVLERGIGTDGA
ncbi:MAG: TetR family transcriptional regulator, partial [Frankia sp.]